MTDTIREAFLTRQQEQARELADSSDLVTVLPWDGTPSSRYLVRLHCRGLVQSPGGTIGPFDRHEFSIWFGEGYLRFADTAEVLSWHAPRSVWHPNIRHPLICIGRVIPGTPLIDLVHRVFEIVTWQHHTSVESDALNYAACQWARANGDRIPVDPRPLLHRHAAAARAARAGEASR